MTDYAAEANEAPRKFNPKEAKRNLGGIAEDGAGRVLREGEQDLRSVRNFIMENPVKGAAYALGAGALLGYLLVPRR